MILWLYVGKLMVILAVTTDWIVNSDIGMSMRTYTGNGSYRNMSHGLGTSNVFLLLIHTIATTDWTGRPIGGSWTDYTTLTDNSSGTFDDYFTWQDTSATSTNVRKTSS